MSANNSRRPISERIRRYERLRSHPAGLPDLPGIGRGLAAGDERAAGGRDKPPRLRSTRRAGCTIRRSVGIRFARRTRSFSSSVSYSLFERGSSCGHPGRAGGGVRPRERNDPETPPRPRTRPSGRSRGAGAAQPGTSEIPRAARCRPVSGVEAVEVQAEDAPAIRLEGRLAAGGVELEELFRPEPVGGGS